MRFDGVTAVVTGGGSGIGRALCERIADEGARVAVVDLDGAAAREMASTLPGFAVGRAAGFAVDVTEERQVVDLVRQVEQSMGPIGLYCSNAGVSLGAGLGADTDWERSWRLHVLAHVYAARAVLPGMVERGAGHFLVTASAAGLLTSLDSASYSTTKHAAVALAEWLAIAHGDTGVGFSCLCPQGVRTPMTTRDGRQVAGSDIGPLLEPAEVADAVVAAIAQGHFLVLPHPEVADYERRRAGDRDRWLAGMRRARARLFSSPSG
jgi:NAD(P)-dependent dehydrogenase (short-subunit alcohol dehydrogenase family)